MLLILWVLFVVTLGLLVVSLAYIVILRWKIRVIRKLAGNGITPHAKVLAIREVFEEKMIIKPDLNSPNVCISFRRSNKNDPLHRVYNVINAISGEIYGEDTLEFNFDYWPDYEIVYDGMPFSSKHFDDFMRVVRADLENKLSKNTGDENMPFSEPPKSLAASG